MWPLCYGSLTAVGEYVTSPQRSFLLFNLCPSQGMLHKHTRTVVLLRIVWGPLGVTATTLGLCSYMARRQLLPPFFVWSHPICCLRGGGASDSLPDLGPRGLFRWQLETTEHSAQVDTGFGADQAHPTVRPLGDAPL